jgi:hypothetical protein
MKTFNEFLKQKDKTFMEMPLRHYGHIFNDPGDRYIDKSEDQDEPLEPLGKGGVQLKARAPYDDNDDIIQGRYTKRDRMVISHPKTFRVLEQKLSKSKYNFNILFIEERKKQQYLIISNTKEIFEKRPELNTYLKSNGIDVQNSITFIQVGSSGHILTPWMILHRIGHAIGGAYNPKGTGGYEHQFYEYPVLQEIRNIIGRYVTGKSLNFFKFKSAVNKNIDSDEEFVHELIAEYLWYGEIRSNSSDANVLKMMVDIGAFIDLLLESCVGKILTVRGE